MNNNLQPLTVHQLMVIDFLKDNKDSTALDIKKGIEKEISNFIKMNPKFENKFPDMVDELVKLNYLETSIVKHRKIYNLIK